MTHTQIPPKSNYVPKQYIPRSYLTTKPQVQPAAPPSINKSISSFVYSSFLQSIGFGVGSIIVGENVVPKLSTASTRVVPIVDNINSDRCKQYYTDYQECIYSGQDCDLLYERYIRCITEAYYK